MSTVSKLLQDVELPRMIRMEQRFPRPCIDDVEAAPQRRGRGRF